MNANSNSARVSSRRAMIACIILLWAALLFCWLAFSTEPVNPANLIGPLAALGSGALFLCVLFTTVATIFVAPFSLRPRETTRPSKRLILLGLLAIFLSFAIPMLIERNQFDNRARIQRTKHEMLNLEAALSAYKTEYNLPLTAFSNQELVGILSGLAKTEKNPRQIPFINLRAPQLNDKGEAIDEWGTPVRFSFTDPENPTAQSAGPDKTRGTKDDIGN